MRENSATRWTAEPSFRTFSEGLKRIAETWHADPARPRVPPRVREAWRALLSEWIADMEAPLFVRKHQRNRGHEIQHVTGRTIIRTDNSPAHWSLHLALMGRCPTLREVRQLIIDDRIPVTAVPDPDACLKCRLNTIRGPNDDGWKVAHVAQIGLKRSGSIEETDIGRLAKHFHAFLDPGNMFLVPKRYGGLAETAEFAVAFSASDDD